MILRHFFTPHDPRLARHVEHDDRSHSFHAAVGTIRSVRWARRVPIFDQGQLGSCTGNALCGALSSEPFDLLLGEAAAVSVYSQATHLDRVRGAYPPVDTGSSGLAVMRAAKARGWIKSYSHAFTPSHVLGALSLRPGITGITWLEGCDSPDRDGIIRYEGPIRGGHEIELDEVDVERRLVGFSNSWGPGWGLHGRFYMSWDDYAAALADHGDATFADLAA